MGVPCRSAVPISSPNTPFSSHRGPAAFPRNTAALGAAARTLREVPHQLLEADIGQPGGGALVMVRLLIVGGVEEASKNEAET